MKRRTAHKGTTLTEIIATLALTTAVLTLASKTIVTTIHLASDAATAQTEASRFDSAMSLLRRDIWNTRQITLVNPQQVVLEQRTGPAVTWRIDKDQNLLRIATTGQTRWPETANDLTFSTEGPQLILNLHPEGQLRLTPLGALMSKGDHP